jgi:hypothetical protein
LWFLGRECPQADRVDQLKNGCVCTDPERQRKDGHCREYRIEPKLAKPETQILGNFVHLVSPAL